MRRGRVGPCLSVQPRLRSTAADGRVPLRARVSPRVAEALFDEASHRRQSASVLLDRLLASELPRLAAERVAAHVCSDGPQLVGTTLTCNDAPGIPAQGISDEFVPLTSSAPSIPASASEPGPVTGGPAT